MMLTRTFHQGPGPGLGCQGPGLHSQGPGQGPGFEYKDQDKDKDLSKCGHVSVNIPGIEINTENLLGNLPQTITADLK